MVISQHNWRLCKGQNRWISNRFLLWRPTVKNCIMFLRKKISWPFSRSPFFSEINNGLGVLRRTTKVMKRKRERHGATVCSLDAPGFATLSFLILIQKPATIAWMNESLTSKCEGSAWILYLRKPLKQSRAQAFSNCSSLTSHEIS